jgi:hypothetical protein
VIAYRATLDVPAELAQFVAKLLLAERHRRGTPRGQPGPDLLLAGGAGAAMVPRLHHPGRGRPASPGDPGYQGAGIGILIPVKQPAGAGDLDINTCTRYAIQRSLRCLGERGFALLTGRWRTFRHITASPS